MLTYSVLNEDIDVVSGGGLTTIVTALDNGLQSPIRLAVVEIKQGHHFIMILKDKPLGVSHVHKALLVLRVWPR